MLINLIDSCICRWVDSYYLDFNTVLWSPMISLYLSHIYCFIHSLQNGSKTSSTTVLHWLWSLVWSSIRRQLQVTLFSSWSWGLFSPASAVRWNTPSASWATKHQLGASIWHFRSQFLTHRDLDKLKIWADRNLMNFNNAEVQNLGWITACSITGDWWIGHWRDVFHYLTEEKTEPDYSQGYTLRQKEATDTGCNKGNYDKY